MSDVKTDAEKFNDELLVLLNKYPNVRLTVDHKITINELAPLPPLPTDAEGAVTPTAAPLAE